MVGFIDRDHVLTRGAIDQQANQHGHWHGKADVANDSGELAAAEARNQDRQFLHITQSSLALAEGGGDGVGGHGWLFGGHCPVENMNQHKPQAVVQTKQQGFA